LLKIARGKLPMILSEVAATVTVGSVTVRPRARPGRQTGRRLW
jgi:hypothetical protein